MSTLSWVIVVLFVVVLAVFALLVQAVQHRRDLVSAVALERARQDMLLNRLASRTPGELAAYNVSEPEIVAPANPSPTVRHLYDDTGLIHDSEFVDPRGDQSHALEVG